jgi:hypothetical protein
VELFIFQQSNMAEKSMSDSAWEEIDKYMKDESFCRMSDPPPKASCKCFQQWKLDDYSLSAVSFNS